MKNLKLLAILLALCSLIFTLSSCNIFSGDGGDQSQDDDNNDSRPTDADPNKADLIFNSAVHLQLIYADTELNSNDRMELAALLREKQDKNFNYTNGTPAEEKAHEIIIGPSSRSVSVKAYEMLDRLMEEEDESKGGYVIYSDGSSLAAAYTEEYTEHIEAIVFDTLLELCDTFELVLPRKVVAQECVDLYAIYAEEDSAFRAEQWAALEEKLGADITDAYKYLYNMYSPDVITWLANLYEPRVCICNNYDENGIRQCLYPKDASGNYVCKNGGFYYSNSGRNTPGYGIDIESTIQALGIIERAGLTREFGGNYVNALPAQIKADIVAFIKSCQDENGFFYHPQWTHEQVDSHLGRRGRDLMWAQSLLEKFGAKPFYDTPGGVKGEGAPEQNIVSPTAMTVRLGTSKITLASKVVAASEPVAAHLVSAETFKAYLDTQPINTYSYNVGNQLAAQSTQLVNRDKQLNGAISKTLFEWANSRQNSKNGLWEPQINHSSVNGLFKILTFYNDFKEPFPYAYEAACSAIAALSSDEIPAHVCSLYNAWWCVGALLTNMERYNPAYTPEQREEIRQSVLSIAAQGLYDTRDSYEQFQKNGAEFSYTPNYSSSTSQGLPVAIPKTAEGDVNATEICLNGLRNHSAYALGVSTPSLFGTLEMVKFLSIIENATPSIKDVVPASEPMDFEYDELGTTPETVTGNLSDASSGILNSGGLAVVGYAPDGRAGKVLHITHLANPGKGDDIRFTNIGNKLDTNCTIFESDMYIASEGTTPSASIAQYTVGNLYMFYMQTTSDGKIKLWEGSAFSIGKSKDRLLATINMDEWFNLRVEYYNGTHDTVRIKLYLNDELLIVSANYFDEKGEKFSLPESVRPEPPEQGDYFRFIGHSSYGANIYFDNLLIACEKKNYKSESNTEGLVYNADTAGVDRVVYDFDEGTLPEGVVIEDTTGKITLDGGVVKLNNVSGTSTLKIPVTVREGMGNVFAFGFDAKLISAPKAGDVFVLTFDVPYAQYGVKRSIELAFKVMQIGNQLCLVGTNSGGKEIFSSAAIPLGGDSLSFEFAYFKEANTALIYANGSYVGSTENFVITSTYKPYHYDFSSATITYKGAMEAEIDNVFAEVRLGSFEEETRPNCDRVEHSFDSTEQNGFETNGTISGGKLTLDNGAYITLAQNDRTNFISSCTLNAVVNTSALANGKATRITYYDAEDNAIFALELVKRGEKIEIYEVSAHGALALPVASFELKEEMSLTINYYVVNGLVTLTVDENVVLSTTIFISENPTKSAYATVSSNGIAIDSIYLEGMNLSYKEKPIVGENLDNSSDLITYEYSSTGNLPSRITTTLKTGGAKAAIELMERDGRIGKILALTTTPGDADQVNFNLSADGKQNANKVVFETDIYFDLAGEAKFEIYYMDSNGKNASKIVFAQKPNDTLTMQYYSNHSNAIVEPGVTLCNAKQWVRLKIEIDMGDGTKDTLSYKTYVNGDLVCTSSNYWGAESGNPCHITAISKIRFSTYNKCEGSIYFDNTSIRAVD